MGGKENDEAGEGNQQFKTNSSVKILLSVEFLSTIRKTNRGGERGQCYECNKKQHKQTKSGLRQSELKRNEERNIPYGWQNQEEFGIA